MKRKEKENMRVDAYEIPTWIKVFFIISVIVGLLSGLLYYKNTTENIKTDASNWPNNYTGSYCVNNSENQNVQNQEPVSEPQRIDGLAQRCKDGTYLIGIHPPANSFEDYRKLSLKWSVDNCSMQNISDWGEMCVIGRGYLPLRTDYTLCFNAEDYVKFETSPEQSQLRNISQSFHIQFEKQFNSFFIYLDENNLINNTKMHGKIILPKTNITYFVSFFNDGEYFYNKIKTNKLVYWGECGYKIDFDNYTFYGGAGPGETEFTVERVSGDDMSGTYKIIFGHL